MVGVFYIFCAEMCIAAVYYLCYATTMREITHKQTEDIVQNKNAQPVSNIQNTQQPEANLPDEAEHEYIEGVVSKIVFTNAENGYTVLRLETDEGMVTTTGSIPGAASGERFVFTGAWTTHPQYGKQFKCDSFEQKAPTGDNEIYRYLASGAIKNIGPSRAKDIVETFGNESLFIIENDPEKLVKIKGISKRAAKQIGQEYKRSAELRKLIDFFSKYDIKPLIATRVYSEYGSSSLDVIAENPYIICNDIGGAEFYEADSIALDIGFESDSPERVSAAIISTLSHNLGNGHAFIPKDKLIPAVSELIGVEVDTVAFTLDKIGETGDVVIESIAGTVACYLDFVYEAEQYIATRLSEMLLRKANKAAAKPDKLSLIIRDTEKKKNITLAKAQLDALKHAFSDNVLVITGGPGTGKTTIIQAILSLYESMGLNTSLCAPTGKAAKRLSEICNRGTATIHRLLGAGKSDNGIHTFQYNEDNKLKEDVIIVDEASMIDILLMQSLLKALGSECRLVLVGDADQLPSVGPGNLFSDIIRSKTVSVVSLTEIFRQSEDSGIVYCAHEVNNGKMLNLSEKYTDFYFLKRGSDEEIAFTIAQLCSNRLPKNLGLKPTQIQVLSPSRKRKTGTAELNHLLRDSLNPLTASKKQKVYAEYIFRVGDKVMQRKNNYDIECKSPQNTTIGTGVFNGESGLIVDIDYERETVTVDFDDKIVSYHYDQLFELEPAFAMTVHKSQGSEYDAVILALGSAAPQLLTRSVLYTAMTRARDLLIIVGCQETFEKMVQNDKRQRRYSGLRARLTGE